ncbi:malonyl-ACP O-methyltransferase BioC [Caldalkalibacillus mannanilyticus]|uniref:malonyl-ACP O-methyltransferase BioC n=1 Tax=Caldalkalibacillus mannanilyticus TaxID=1418 RepID=UPI00055446F1|nr:malonyl-ACP O-methyltransferase BioC [Caldalkalibacillus mannanilyticus]
MINKQLVQKRFSKSAATYDQYAQVQKKMADDLLREYVFKSINPLTAKKELTILEIGCGTGYLTEKLGQAFPLAHITAVDLAPGMIEVARTKLSSPRVHFICGDIEEMELVASYDLIISNATFQWFNDLENTLHKLYSHLSEEGSLCFSTFGERTFLELHTSYQKAKGELGISSSSELGQRFCCIQELYAFFSDKEENILTHEGEEYEYFPSVIDFFHSVKKVGANNSNQDGSMLNRRLLQKIIQYYEQEYSCAKGIRATYHSLFFCIRK